MLRRSCFPRRALGVLAVATLILQTMLPVLAANLIVNGNFETGPNPGSFATLKGGDTSIAGWTVTGVSVDYIGTYWRGADGGRSVDLDGTPGPGGIVQTIATRRGASYVVAFMLSGNGDCGPTVKRMQVSAGPVTRIYTFSTTQGSVQRGTWVRRSFTFRAGGTQTRIALRSINPTTNCGPVVDDVTVSGPPGARLPMPAPPATPASGSGPSAAVPCYVNSGALAALARPCFGPPNSTITVIQERPTPPDLMLLFTANLTFSTAGAVSTPLSAFSGGIATASAPAALCAGSSPHKWNVWLVDSTGKSQGVIGDYTMTACP